MSSRVNLSPTSEAIPKALASETRGAAGKALELRIDPYNQTPEQEDLHSIRLPQLDQQSAQDFLSSFRLAMRKEFHQLPSHMSEALAAKGIDMNANVSREEAWNYLMAEPLYAMSSRLWVSVQQQMWSNIRAVFHYNAEVFFAELERTDHSGPGTLELNPGMHIPDAARHEIHLQPGGYVGDPFAGGISQYGNKQFDRGFSNNDFLQQHLLMAQETPIPRDGKVNRILDMGTGFGGFATSLKERFPGSEVWGIDVGGPMVRWAHYRAVKMNIDVNFAQRLAEDTKFKDSTFDIVVSYILHHEVHPDVHENIVKEAYRILRPGGVYYPVDFKTKGNPGAPSHEDFMLKALYWRDHRYNNEIWSPAYIDTDFPALMKSAGFTDMVVDHKSGTYFQNVYGFKRS